MLFTIYPRGSGPGRKFIIVVLSLKRNGDEEVNRRVKHGISEKWNKRDHGAILQV